jgi:hypothetical protein
MSRYCTARWQCGHTRTAATTARDGRCKVCLAAVLKRNWRPSPNAQRVSQTHFVCGHPRDEANSTSEAHPRCITCHRSRQVRSYKQFKCGHDVSAENVVMRGPFRTCKTCRSKARPARRHVRSTTPRRYGKQKYQDRYNCGHPRTPENSTAIKRPACKQCRLARDKARLNRFHCGHDATPENTAVHEGSSRTVRRCKQCLGVRRKGSNHAVVLKLERWEPFAPLPIVDMSGRSYESFPLKSQRSA